MLCRRIIPCLDVKDGRIVKGVRFSELQDAGDPATRAAFYEEQGADEIVMLDVSATPEKRRTSCQTVAEIRAAISIPLIVGGGIGCIADAAALLDSGADKVAVNSAAVERPQLIKEISQRFGSQCCVLSLDAAANSIMPSGFEVVVSCGKKRCNKDARTWAKEAVELGAGEILLTSWDRDGTGLGYELKLISSISAALSVPVIASGGANSTRNFEEAFKAGAEAVLAASIFHYEKLSIASIKQQLMQAGFSVRIN